MFKLDIKPLDISVVHLTYCMLHYLVLKDLGLQTDPTLNLE